MAGFLFFLLIYLQILCHPLVIPYLYPARKAALAEKGLSLLVNRTLGKKLDKTFQVSDWERRPLSGQQLRYAGKFIFSPSTLHTITVIFLWRNVDKSRKVFCIVRDLPEDYLYKNIDKDKRSMCRTVYTLALENTLNHRPRRSFEI